MSRGFGARQRAIITALDEPGYRYPRSVSEITRAVDGPRYTAPQLRATQRAIAGLAAAGVLTETRRRGRYGAIMGGGPRLRVYQLAPAYRTVTARWPCPGCGRRVMVTEPGKGGPYQQEQCSACLRAAAVKAARAGRDSVRGRLRGDERLQKLVTLALDPGASDSEAVAALRAARRRERGL